MKDKVHIGNIDLSLRCGDGDKGIASLTAAMPLLGAPSRMLDPVVDRFRQGVAMAPPPGRA